MPKHCVLSNYLWIPKEIVRGDPSEFAPEWEYRIPLLSTPEGKLLFEQLSAIHEDDADDDWREEIPKDMVIKTWTESDGWWLLCAGNLDKVRALKKRLGLKIKDKRSSPKWPDEVADAVKVLMPPRAYQVEPLNDWLTAGFGVFKAAPAFGKTYIMISAAVHTKMYTLVLTHTDYLADQFLTRIREGSPKDLDDGTTTYDPVTNILEVEEDLGVTIAGRYRSPGDIYPITVATYQSFTSKSGRVNLRGMSHRFGQVLVDECHAFATPSSSRVINTLKAKRKMGVSATPDRKDTMEVVMYDALGPITAKGSTEQLPITATMIATGQTYRGGRIPRRGDWAYMLNSLCKNQDRNELIQEWAEYDIQNERFLIILSERRQWCLDMAESLTRAGMPSEAVLGGMTSDRARKKREKTVQRMMDGEIHAICATSTFKLGVDIPCVSTVYATCPMNNLPQLEQAIGRARRPYEGKNESLFRYFVDGGHGLLYGCARATNKHLLNLGANMVFIPEGVKPGFSAFADGYETESQERSERRSRKRGLRRAAASSGKLIEKLFDDLKNDAKQLGRYKDRMNR